MRNNLRTLAWLRWKQFRDEAVYWMRVLGYTSDKSMSARLYPLYLLGIGLVWFGTVWTWAFDQANIVGALLTGDALTSILNTLPVLALIGEIYVLIVALNSTPLKLSFADMAYIAGSPVNPGAPVVFGFVRQIILRIVLIGMLFAIISVVLIRHLGSNLGTVAVFRSITIIIPFLTALWALAWLLGILRLVYPQVRRLRYLWLTPLLLLPLAYLFPTIFLWPGRALILYVYGEAPVWFLPSLIVVAIGLVYSFIRLGQRIDMVQAVDESILYARIQALGLLAWRQIDLQVRIRMQNAQAARKPLFHLPANASGFRGLAAKAAISYVRHPFMVLFNLLWGALITELAVLIVGNNLPVQLWIALLLSISIAPPLGLLYVFRVDVEERFLRQFLPVSGFALLIADIIVPLFFMIVGCLGIWLLNGFPPEVTVFGLTFIPVLAILLALCGAYSMTTRRVLQTRILTTCASFGAVMFAGVNFHSPTAAFVVAIIAILIISGIVSTNA